MTSLKMAETTEKMDWSEEILDNTTQIECVVTRYTEHLNWLNYLPPAVTTIRVYNKNKNNSNFFTKGFECTYSHKIQHQTVENVGRHNETIARYISENYNNLPDVMMFIPGTIMMTPQKGLYLSQMSRNLSQLGRFKGFYSPNFIKVGKKYNYIAKEFENGPKLAECAYKSFNEWKESIIPGSNIKFVCYRGMMVVAKENILKHPREVYIKILADLQWADNITFNGFYAERFWAFLFRGG